MAISERDLAELRSLVGQESPPTDDQLNDAWVRLGSIKAVALEVQRARLAQLRSQPSRLTIDGDRTEDWSGTIPSLERQVAQLEREITEVADPSTGAMRVGRFVRAGRAR